MEYLKWAFDLFLHLDVHLKDVVENYGIWTYAILFLVIFCETGLVVTPFLPGDSLLFAAGTLGSIGGLNPHYLFLLLGIAAILGDTANYWIGAYIGPKAFSGQYRLLKKEHLDRTHRFYEKHGGKTIILARFIPIIRTFAPFVAGVGAMSYGRFLLYNIMGGLAWVAMFVYGGYFFAEVPFVKKNFSLVVVAIVFVSVLPVVYEFSRARCARPMPTDNDAAIPDQANSPD
jgi:membrane-associated protein